MSSNCNGPASPTYIGTPSKRTGTSYGVRAQLKDHHMQSSPGKQASRLGTSSPRTTNAQEELVRLQQANSDLLSKLALLELKVPGVSRLLGLSKSTTGDGCVHVNTTNLGWSPASKVEGGQANSALEDLAQDTSMRCYMLSHHWGLAKQLRVYEDVAVHQAEQWAAKAPSLQGFVAVAQRLATPYLPVGCSWSSPSTQMAPSSELSWPHMATRGSHEAVFLMEVMTVEHATRRMAELGIVSEVVSSLLRQLNLGTETEHLKEISQAAPAAALHDHATQQEVLVQTVWLSYIWARAASSNLLPHVAADKAACWAARMHALPGQGTGHGLGGKVGWEARAQGLRQLCDVTAGRQELARLGVEQALMDSLRPALRYI